MKKSIIILYVAFLSATTFAQTAKHINLKNGIAIQGYDPVAYFESTKAIEGKKEITAKFNDATYQFASENNKDLFLKNPTHYEPQFGGFCAFGMSEGYEAPIKPEAFTVVEDKLYLNYNLKVREDWSKNKEARIVKATINWGKIKK
jgi:YHS domain-containing protein